jgi:hypothetical protein
MSAIREYDVVRVRSLDGCHGCAGLGARVPVVGDTGTVVSLLSADGQPDLCLVECVMPDATTAWIASFPEHVLERIESSEIAP